MKKLLFLVLTTLLFSACSGTRVTGNSFTTHAESFRILGHAIPADDQKAAMMLVPKGGKIENISSTPADWTSFTGAIGNIFWFHGTEVGGTI